MTISNETKNNLTITNENKGTSGTWSDFPVPWSSVNAPWSNPGIAVVNGTKNTMSTTFGELTIEQIQNLTFNDTINDIPISSLTFDTVMSGIFNERKN